MSIEISNDRRRPWREGGEGGPAAESWLALPDDELLLRIQAADADKDAQERLVEVVWSDRHFFLRQEAAKRIRDLEPILPFTEDRHLGQILVRRLNRQDDAAYLEGLIARTPYLEVKRAAAAQLSLLRNAGEGGGTRLRGPATA
jgi:hypothetical protein